MAAIETSQYVTVGTPLTRGPTCLQQWQKNAVLEKVSVGAQLTQMGVAACVSLCSYRRCPAL